MVRPWEASPYGLVSWWDMEQFGARKFYQAGRLLERVRSEHDRWRVIPVVSEANKRLTAEQVGGLQNFMEAIKEQLDSLGLRVACEQVNYISSSAATFTNHQAADQLENLDRMVRWEMEKHMFFFLTPDEADLYRQNEPPFGQEVEDHFPSANFDISESGKCLALSRGTACVMHLMRVLERGLNVFADELGVRFERREWETIINDLELAIKGINGPHAGADWRERQHFYSEAAKDFRYFKNAWRNHAMHARERYDVEEAKPIFEHVKSFMGHLATRLRE